MTKTDFKNIYEAFMHCDTNKLKKEFAAMYSDNEEQAAAVKEVDRAFARMKTVTPKAVNPDEQSIIVVCKGFGDEGDDTVCIEVEDLRKWKEEHLKESEPISDEMLTFMSTDEIENAVMKQDLPTKYAMIRILEPGLEVLDPKYDIVMPEGFRHGNAYIPEIMEEVGRKIIHLLEEIYGRKASPEIWALNNFKEFEAWYNANKKELETNARKKGPKSKTAAKKAA